MKPSERHNFFLLFAVSPTNQYKLKIIITRSEFEENSRDLGSSVGIFELYLMNLFVGHMNNSSGFMCISCHGAVVPGNYHHFRTYQLHLLSFDTAVSKKSELGVSVKSFY